MRTQWLLLSLLVATSLAAAASGTHHQNPDVCRTDRAWALESWQRDYYEVPQDIQPLMLAAIHGEAPQVLDALAAMQPQDVQRWRQLALYTAAMFGQSATVDALLSHGAEADASVSIPAVFACKQALYNHAVAKFLHTPHPESGEAMNPELECIAPPSRMAEALFAAIKCDDAATAEVLLLHHADPMQLWRPHTDVDPFLSAVVQGDVKIIWLFLDHGADPCVEDRRLAVNANKRHAVAATVANIGAKVGMPPALIDRLTCHAPLASP
ncbi:MAG: hypothetical protein ACREPU_03535 [Rhodanobacteraceae bacterium]